MLTGKQVRIKYYSMKVAISVPNLLSKWKNLHAKEKTLKSWPHLILGEKAEELGNESTKLDKFLERFVMVVFCTDQGVL